MRKARILVSDADRSTVKMVATILGRAGYEIITASDGKGALAIARQLRPDLVILDVSLPLMDGYLVCQHLKSDPDTAGIAVLILTTRGDIDADVKENWQFADIVQDRVKGYDMGAVEFLNKPVSARALVRRVKTVLWAGGIQV
jgi:DNA-binding response OmpR family regulator